MCTNCKDSIVGGVELTPCREVDSLNLCVQCVRKSHKIEEIADARVRV